MLGHHRSLHQLDKSRIGEVFQTRDRQHGYGLAITSAK
jgi:hypothetical protein